MPLRRLVLVIASMLALAGCPGRNESLHDAGGAAAITEFDAPIAFEDEAVRALSPDALPATSAPCAPPALGIVAYVLDGDTIGVQRVADSVEVRVRLIGVDSPEVSREAGVPAECHSGEATRFTEQLLGRPVWLTYDADCQDDFGRDLAYVWVGSSFGAETSSDLWNRQMLRRGLARTLTIRPNDAFAPTFSADEAAAEAAGAGLWSACM